VGAGLVKVARLPYTAASVIIREVTPGHRSPHDGK
jgi:hypothetical protein